MKINNIIYINEIRVFTIAYIVLLRIVYFLHKFITLQWHTPGTKANKIKNIFSAKIIGARKS